MSLSKADINDTYVSEMIKYQNLVSLGTGRSSASGTWVSTSSSVSYSYTSESDLMSQLKTALLSYMIIASDWNSILNGSAIYTTTTGTANTYVASPSLGLISYNEGLTLRLKFNISNTSASTINVDSLGVKNIKKFTISGKSNISTGDIITDGIYILVYDDTDFILINPNNILTFNGAYKVLGTNSSNNNISWIDSLQSLLTTTGDIIYTSSANTPARLALGSNGQAVTSNGTNVAYSFPSPCVSAASNDIILSSLTERSDTNLSGITGYAEIRVTDYAGNTLWSLKTSDGSPTTSYVTYSSDKTIPINPSTNIADITISLSSSTTIPLVEKKRFILKYGGVYRIVFDAKYTSTSPYGIYIKNVYIKGIVSINGSDTVVTD